MPNLVTVTSVGDTWTCWTEQTSSSTANTVWEAWTSGSTTSTDNSAQRRVVLTPEQVESLRREQERRNREADEEAQKGAQAKSRAEGLLVSLLTAEQRDQLEKMSAFVVRSERNRLYRIRRGRARNIEELDENGKVVARLCIHPNENVPDADTMLAQKLMLETSEAEFLRIANRTIAH